MGGLILVAIGAIALGAVAIVGARSRRSDA
jgi:hypothetical protein